MSINATAGTVVAVHEDIETILSERARECNERRLASTVLPQEPYCPMTFDGWSCWPATPAGSTAYIYCPDFITGFDGKLKAHKYCEPNGTWFRHPDSNMVWSNYTTCVNMDNLHWLQSINHIYEIGYAISIVALLLSLAILRYFRALRCARITLHMNLFISFVLNNALWLIWYRFVVSNTDILIDNSIICRSLHVVLHYFLLTNYSWMLCEGFYLHTILVMAFTSEQRLVTLLMIFGWIVPALIVTVYTVLRATSNKRIDTEQCWIYESDYTNTLLYPVCVSTLLNVLFLFNIVRVLLKKLRAGPAIGARPSRAILQAFRATMLLVPLLGLHYLVIPFRPPKGHPWEPFYEIISAITASFQGLCVATFFCFCNGEVIAHMKRRWEGIRLRRRANSSTVTTFSVQWRKRRCDYPAKRSFQRDKDNNDDDNLDHESNVKQWMAIHEKMTTNNYDRHHHRHHHHHNQQDILFERNESINDPVEQF